MIDLLSSSPATFAIYVFALLLAITIHELSHAYVADRLGDPTPRLQGRISFNPLVHLDLFGMMFLLFFGFGWGKPVQFDPFNLKNPQKDSALISLAGPFSNFVLAALLALLLYVIPDSSFQSLVSAVIYLNILLGVFNLLPIAPLDGFKVVGGLLPSDKAGEWYQLERYGIFFLILLILPFGGSNMLATIISPIVRTVMGILVPNF